LRPDARAFLEGTRRFAQHITPDPGGSALTSGLGGRPSGFDGSTSAHIWAAHIWAYGPLYALSAPGAFGAEKLFSEETARLIDAEVRKIICECHDEARRLLNAHRKQLDALVKALLERETLDEKEILEVTGLPPAPALKGTPRQGPPPLRRAAQFSPVSESQP